jgi:hippurate hydrolase
MSAANSIISAVGVPAEVYERQVALRRALHRRPELSWKEEETAARIEAALKDAGVASHRVEDTGVVVDIRGSKDGPRVALRADTDALPIVEETGLEFASEHEGVMHACGHDGHSAMLFGAALLLTAEQPLGPVRLIWQPAEEEGNGAPRLMQAGVLEGVGAIFGGHVDPRYDPGVLVVTDGAVGASTDEFVITVIGEQGHGARPHTARDAIVIASHLVSALQAIVAREIDPAQPAVVTVGSFHAGSAPNIIAGEAVLEGTLRALAPDVRAHLNAALRRVCEAVAKQHGAKVRIKIVPGTPPVLNHKVMTSIARDAACAVVGAERVESLRAANMGGEDFACYLEQIPGCYIRFGAKPASEDVEKPAPAHSSRFDFDERALAVGAAWFAKVARMATERL